MRRRERAEREQAEAEQRRESARIVVELIDQGKTSALHWHELRPWNEGEHRQLLVAEVEARAEAAYENESPGELHTLTPWHHLPTRERMKWREQAYRAARDELYGVGGVQ